MQPKNTQKNKQPYFLPAPIIILINNSCTYNVAGFTFISLPHFVVQFSSVLSHVWLFVTPWTAAHQASLSITNSWSLLKLVSIELVIPSNHLILCHPLLLSSIFPSIRVFTNESILHIGGQSIRALASASVLPVNIQDWFPLGLTCFIPFQSQGLSRVFSNTTVQKHQFFVHFFFIVQIPHPYMTTGKTIALTRLTFVGKVMSLLFNMMSRSVIAFLSRSKCLLNSRLQSPSTVVLEPKKIKSLTVSIVSPSIWLDAIILVFWVLTQLFHSPLSLSSRGSSVPLCFLP